MYSIFLSDKAKKELKKLPPNVQRIILNEIYSIKHDPFRHLVKLQGSNLWRLRIMDYRAVVDVILTENKIIVLTIDKRSRVYDR